MALHIYTSGNINNIDKIFDLHKCIESIKKTQNKIFHHVSIYCEPTVLGDLTINEFLGNQDNENYKMILYTQNKYLHQFDHLSHIFKNNQIIKDDDYVLFLDYKDVLLSIPVYQNYSVVRSYQYILDGDDAKLTWLYNLDELISYINSCDNMNIANDFSGYIVQQKHIKTYFNFGRKNMLPYTEDLNFMKFADNFGSILDEHTPYVINRINPFENNEFSEFAKKDLEDLLNKNNDPNEDLIDLINDGDLDI